MTGSILFRGAQIVGAGEAQLQNIRGEQIGFVFQEHTALNPVLRVEKANSGGLGAASAPAPKGSSATARQLARGVGCRNPSWSVFPHQLSGGQRQQRGDRHGDELSAVLVDCRRATTALDATVQRRIVDLMMNATQQHGTSLLMITHDMALATHTAQRLIVMRQRSWKKAGPFDVLRYPRAEYTKTLTKCSPAFEPATGRLGVCAEPSCAGWPGGSHGMYDAEKKEIADMNLFELRGVEKHYDSCEPSPFRSGRGRGALLGIIGESGSGKTTLIRLMMGDCTSRRRAPSLTGARRCPPSADLCPSDARHSSCCKTPLRH